MLSNATMLLQHYNCGYNAIILLQYLVIAILLQSSHCYNTLCTLQQSAASKHCHNIVAMTCCCNIATMPLGICSRLPLEGTLDGWIPKKGTRCWWAETHSKTAQTAELQITASVSVFITNNRSYLTRSISDTAQKLSPCPDSHNLHVSMSRSYSTWPGLIRPLRASDDIHVPILQELTLEIA